MGGEKGERGAPTPPGDLVSGRRSEVEPSASFDPGGAEPDPIGRFRRWWDAARAADPDAADAMALATASPDGRPSVRMVILRGFDERGFVFFTNDQSPKARDLAANPKAAVVMYWPWVHRQVRAVGPVGRVTDAESTRYFASRPPGHRLAAWASPQSQVIEGRAELDRRVDEVAGRFPGEEIPRPPFWGGFRLAPEEIEFWQGRENRLHDRVRYMRAESGWLIERLAP